MFASPNQCVIPAQVHEGAGQKAISQTQGIPVLPWTCSSCHLVELYHAG